MENNILNSFINNHGINILNEFKNLIIQDLNNNNLFNIFDDNYFLYVFEIAFFEFCGIEIDNLPVFITKFNSNDYIPPLSFDNIIELHKNSINFLKDFLNSNTPDF